MFRLLRKAQKNAGATGSGQRKFEADEHRRDQDSQKPETSPQGVGQVRGGPIECPEVIEKVSEGYEKREMVKEPGQLRGRVVDPGHQDKQIGKRPCADFRLLPVLQNKNLHESPHE